MTTPIFLLRNVHGYSQVAVLVFQLYVRIQLKHLMSEARHTGPAGCGHRSTKKQVHSLGRRSLEATLSIDRVSTTRVSSPPVEQPPKPNKPNQTRTDRRGGWDLCSSSRTVVGCVPPLSHQRRPFKAIFLKLRCNFVTPCVPSLVSQDSQPTIRVHRTSSHLRLRFLHPIYFVFRRGDSAPLNACSPACSSLQLRIPTQHRPSFCQVCFKEVA